MKNAVEQKKKKKKTTNETASEKEDFKRAVRFTRICTMVL